MKLNIFYILIASLLVSCSNSVVEHSKQVYTKNTTQYSIEISTIETKINSQGHATCSKHVRTTKTDSLYFSYGLNLTTQLAYSLGTTEKYMLDTSNNLKDIYLEIRLKNKSNTKLNHDSIINKSLTETFNLTIQPKETQVKGYALNIVDSIQLQHVQAICGNGLVTYDEGLWHSKAIKLQSINKIIDSYSDEYIRFNVPNNKCYTLDFLINKNFNKMNDKLESYGLKLDRATFNQRFFELTPLTR